MTLGKNWVGLQYSVADVYQIVSLLRWEHFGDSREEISNNGILLCDPMTPHRFMVRFREKIGLFEYDTMPNSIITPILFTGHWRVFRITKILRENYPVNQRTRIDLSQNKKVKISLLCDDPEGSENVPSELKEVISFIEQYYEIVEQVKKYDCQQAPGDGRTNGPVLLSNIRDYITKSSIANNAINYERDFYTIRDTYDYMPNEREYALSLIRSGHVDLVARYSGLEIPPFDGLEELLQADRQAILKDPRLQGLDLNLASSLSSIELYHLLDICCVLESQSSWICLGHR